MTRRARILAASALLTLSTAIPAYAGEALDTSSTLSWGPCPEGSGVVARATCATFTVPKDYDDPSAGTIELTMSKIPATGKKKGVIAGNPGGPGGDALGMFSDPADDDPTSPRVRLPDSIGKDYDLIAVEPRGLTWGTPLNCEPPRTSMMPAAALYEACESHNPGYTKTVNTANTARDLEEARKYLGEKTLNLYGVSYGGILMSTYATLFPSSTHKVILDSSASPRDWANDMAAKRQRTRQEAVRAFFSWIAEQDAKYHLGTTPREVYRSFASVIRDVYGVAPPVRPQPAGRDDVHAVPDDYAEAAIGLLNTVDSLSWKAGRFIDVMKMYAGLLPVENIGAPTSTAVTSLYDQKTWPELAQAVSDAKAKSHHEGSLQEPSRKPGSGDSTDALTPDMRKQQEIQQKLVQAMMVQSNAVICNENATPPDHSKLLPYLGSLVVPGDALEANDNLIVSGAYCGGWPTNTPFAPVSGHQLTVKPLHLGYDKDTAVSETGAPDMRDARGGELHIYHGYSHGVLIQDADLAAQTVADYMNE